MKKRKKNKKEVPTIEAKKLVKRFPPEIVDFHKKVISTYPEGSPVPLFFHGAFGDLPDCVGVIEPGGVTDAPGGGKQVKLWGCTYLYKGYPEDFVTDGGALSLGKAMISAIPRNVFTTSKP